MIRSHLPVKNNYFTGGVVNMPSREPNNNQVVHNVVQEEQQEILEQEQIEPPVNEHDEVRHDEESENLIAARKIVVDSEKFAAAVEPPPKGMLNPSYFDVVKKTDDMDDDQFFHLACHVDSSLKAKIERGEYVELEKLLPKCKPFQGKEGRLEWTVKDGMTFLTPAYDREQKINNFKKWDQAFRVYATITVMPTPQELVRSGSTFI